MSIVSAYLESLKEIEDDPVFISEGTDQLDKEISENMWMISMTSHEATSISIGDLIDFLNRVIANRKQQLVRSSLKVDLQFYLWFDEQSCQLRFNLINSSHSKLPFGCQYILTDKADEIIESFLSSNQHDKISFREMEDVTNKEGIEAASKASNAHRALPVYSAIIKAN